MEYTDNPRKVYGKVEITYSDAEISGDLETVESGNSEVSHPYEVYRGFSQPTCKACTMDGHSTMDGTYQMIDDSCVVGWWSGALSGSDGVFAEPPYIEVSFVKRPIISWKIKGDEKLNQYPVDFKIEYKTDGVVVKTDVITGNTKMDVTFRPTIEDVTSVRLTIQKWSKGNACAKMVQIFEMLMEIYEGDAMQMFEVNEELGAADGGYNINSDTMTVTLHNTNRKFDKGYLRSLLILDRKIKPSIGIEINGVVKYTVLGTFYSDEWQVDQDSQWVKCTAVDKLLRLQAMEYSGFPLTEDVSLYEMTRDILLQAGFEEDKFFISECLKERFIPMGYMPRTTIWDALQEIANAGLCRVYMDRDDRLVVRAEEETPTHNEVRIHPGNMFSYVSNITLTEFANCISVDYSEVSLTEDIVDTAEITITLAPSETRKIGLNYTSEIAYAMATADNANVRITDFKGGVDNCTFTAVNRTEQEVSTTITVSGSAIEVSTKTIQVRDEESINTFGVVEYSHTSSDLVQTLSHAEHIGNILLSKIRAGEGVVTTSWRGNPALRLGDTFDCEDRFGDEKKFVCEYNKITYDGGLKQETRGRKV